MTQVFLIGATGHIGGAILNAIVDKFPNIPVVALVRDHRKAEKLQEVFRGIQIRIGGLRDVKVIESESRTAKIVINASPDGLAESPEATKAALRGLASRPVRGFYIQTSGAYIIGEDVDGQKPTDRVWSDISDIRTITNMPSDRYHSYTDRIVRQASTSVNVAIISPTVVYGVSSSTGRRIPITVQDIISTAKKLSMGFTMSQGRNILGYIHVEDLAEIYVSLLADAVQSGDSNTRLWGPNAYYFANGEEHTSAKYMEALVKIMKDRGVIPTDVVEQVRPDSDTPEFETVKKIATTHAFGANVRCRSDRAKEFLGFVPKGPGLLETLPEIVDLSLSAA